MFLYRVAGQDIWFSGRIAELEPFAAPDAGTLRFLREPDAAAVRLICRTSGLIGGSLREVEVWDAPPGIMLKVDGASDFLLMTAPTNSIHQVRRNVGGVIRNRVEPDAAGRALDVEVALGPALVLVLAYAQTFCLHASAVVIDGRVIAFAGESGRGKSTLARELSSSVAVQARWAADDILPVMASESGTFALPRFPQLKVPADAQPGALLPEILPLERIFILEQADSETQLSAEQLAPAAALEMMLRHTVGSRLFSPGLLKAHLEFCANVAARVPVFRLLYPHSTRSIGEVERLLSN